MNDITALLMKEQRCAGNGREGHEEAERRIGKEEPQAVGQCEWERREEQDNRFVWFSGRRAASMQHRRRSSLVRENLTLHFFLLAFSFPRVLTLSRRIT